MIGSKPPGLGLGAGNGCSTWPVHLPRVTGLLSDAGVCLRGAPSLTVGRDVGGAVHGTVCPEAAGTGVLIRVLLSIPLSEGGRHGPRGGCPTRETLDSARGR